MHGACTANGRAGTGYCASRYARRRDDKHAKCRQHRQPVSKDQSKGGVRGYDAGKKVNGRKRHLIVDTLGLVLKAFVTEAHYPDGTLACWLFPLLLKRFPRLRVLWGDGTYRGRDIETADKLGQFRLETIERDPT